MSSKSRIILEVVQELCLHVSSKNVLRAIYILGRLRANTKSLVAIYNIIFTMLDTLLRADYKLHADLRQCYKLLFLHLQQLANLYSSKLDYPHQHFIYFFENMLPLAALHAEEVKEAFYQCFNDYFQALQALAGGSLPLEILPLYLKAKEKWLAHASP